MHLTTPSHESLRHQIAKELGKKPGSHTRPLAVGGVVSHRPDVVSLDDKHIKESQGHSRLQGM